MKVLGKIEEIFSGTALLVTILILFANVVLRYVFKASTSWAEELIKYLMIWITFIGGSICVRRGAHVSIDFFINYLPLRARRGMSVIIYIGSAVFSAVMAFYGLQLIQFTIATGQMSPALQIPMWVPYLSMPIGFSLMTLRYVQDVFKALKNSDKIEGKVVE
jgi:C4-dicarboxylate transporter, DctQ subunit